METSFGGIRWMCQVSDDLVVFSEQSGFYGRTKQVRFTPHASGGIPRLCIETQVQEDTNLPPIFAHVVVMHEIASHILGMDRFCDACWRLIGNEDCSNCVTLRDKQKDEQLRCFKLGHDPVARTDGASWCRRCNLPTNAAAQAWGVLPEWLRKLSDVDFDRITAYRKARWGLDHR